MGLDMYLYRKVFVGAHWEHRKITGTIEIYENGKEIPVNFEAIYEVVEQAAYWRKANAIHKWFVDNVQDGEDDCGEYYVPRPKLHELLKLVNKVLDGSKLVDGIVTNGARLEEGEWKPNFEAGRHLEDNSLAHELLPVQEGFFFGSTDYDQWYWEDLKYTKETLTKLLNEEGGDFYYHSSW